MSNNIILIAEDEFINYFFLETVIKKMNIDLEIIHAQDGAQAVFEVRNNPIIKMVLMDIRMPEMSGFEATEEIRKFNTTIPIIAQTAYSAEDDKKKALAVGCNNFLPKPVNVRLLEQLIMKYINE